MARVDADSVAPADAREEGPSRVGRSGTDSGGSADGTCISSVIWPPRRQPIRLSIEAGLGQVAALA